MIKKRISIFFLFSTLFSLISCSSDSGKSTSKVKLLTFDIYDQKLETLLETVADRYDLGLDFGVEETDKTYSLSIMNSSIFDILKKLEADTGFYMMVIDDEIVVEDEMIDDTMTEITLQLNDNLWKDIKSVSSKTEITESCLVTSLVHCLPT